MSVRKSPPKKNRSYLDLACFKCGEMVHNVGEDTTAVICYRCVIKTWTDPNEWVNPKDVIAKKQKTQQDARRED